MNPQSLLDRGRARPFFFPPEPAAGPRVPAPPRDEESTREPMSGPLAIRRRALLEALTGGSASPLSRPEGVRRRDPVLALLQRITQGFSLAEYERAKAMGYEAYLEEQLDHLSIDDSEMDERLLHYPSLFMSPKELWDTYNADFADPYLHFKGAMLVRSTNSKRQLFERMCEFWNDHFCIDHNKGNLEWIFLPEHDRTVIRQHALGSFPEMLEACAFGGAMLYYLDNWLNVRGTPQANYARELLELHTLGVHGGYNESDVTEVAKCFTGWTLNGDPTSPDWMRGTFDHTLHTPGQKFVLGHVIPDSPAPGQPGGQRGRNDAQQVIDIAVSHPSTAEFLARKLINWLLTPAPPQVLVDRVAETYRATNGDIKSMLRVILARQNMGTTSAVLGAKFRRPFHFMVSIFRAFDGQVQNPIESLSHLGAMGHMPFDHAQPNGYPDVVEAWGNSLVPRWNFAGLLLKPLFGSYRGVYFIRLMALKARLEFADASDRPGLAQRMNERLFGTALTPHEQDVLQQFIDNYPLAYDDHALFDSLVLAACLPGFQWY